MSSAPFSSSQHLLHFDRYRVDAGKRLVVRDLSNLKAENGFRRVDLPRYYVPLTRIGKMGFRGGLHHNFVDRVTAPLLAILREQRSRWYNRKSSASIDHS